MTRNYSEEDSVKKGLASLAVALGASEGDVAQIDADGNVTLAPSNGGSSSFTDVVTIDPNPGPLTGRIFDALSTLTPQVVWDYDGGQVLSVAITGYLPNAWLGFVANDDFSGNVSGFTDDNGDVTLTHPDVGFSPGDGPDFQTHIHTPTGLFGDVPTERTLSVGTPYSATESYRLGVVAVCVPRGGNNSVGNETSVRGMLALYPTSKFDTPLWVYAADGQATDVLRVTTANGTSLFRITSDGTPHFSGAGVPVVPATPTAQDVTDALVALGLVTQAP